MGNARTGLSIPDGERISQATEHTLLMIHADFSPPLSQITIRLSRIRLCLSVEYFEYLTAHLQSYVPVQDTILVLPNGFHEGIQYGHIVDLSPMIVFFGHLYHPWHQEAPTFYAGTTMRGAAA